MEIVIKIPDDAYNILLKEQRIPNGLDLEYLIMHGTPLPKGHGRLIDADAANEIMLNQMCGTGYQSRAMRVLESQIYTPTIIEADIEESEEV